MWSDLTNTPCLGNTYSKLSKYVLGKAPVMIASCQPCTDYCIGSSTAGDQGETGWMFVDQANIILLTMPLVFRLEMSSNAVQVNEGREYGLLITRLKHFYVIHSHIVNTWDMGDPPHRHRLFIVGIHRYLGPLAQVFEWPAPAFNENRCHKSRDIAVPDDDVPKSFWRRDNSKRLEQTCPTPGRLHKLARAAPGMGSSSCPNLITSWEGAAPGPTTTNGGTRRPALSWIDTGSNPVGPTRLTVPTESVRNMSLPCDYKQWVSSFDSTNEFLWLCCGNGVPLRTCSSIDAALLRVVSTWMGSNKSIIPKQPPTITTSNYNDAFIRMCSTLFCDASATTNTDHAQALECIIERSDKRFLSLRHHDTRSEGPYMAFLARRNRGNIRSALIDTGANRSLLFRDVEPYMHTSGNSNMTIQVAAQGTQINGSRDGWLQAIVLGPEQATLEIEATTVDKLHRELISIDPYYKEGFNILLKQPDYEDGVPQMYKPATRSQPEVKIPFRYDHSEGGFMLDYLLVNAEKQRPIHALMLEAFSEDHYSNHKDELETLPADLNQDQTIEAAQRTFALACTTEIFFGHHADERMIKGVKAGLRKRKRDLTFQDFHECYGHFGAAPNCELCKLTAGTMRRIFKPVDPHRETRPAYHFHMDTITWSHRSFQGNKYETLIKDPTSGFQDSLFLYLRSDHVQQFQDWVTTLRADPSFHDLPYKPCTIVTLDNAGEWELDHAEWAAMAARLGIDMRYTSADRKEENAVAERAIGIKEPKVKAAMLQLNLEPAWWEYKSAEHNWLANRLPLQSQLCNVPPDGDMARPLEILTRGRISRRTLDRQLYYFVPAGSPALVHNVQAKGSQLPSEGGGTKSRWMVAVRMHQEQPIFWCPRTKQETKSKSFTTFKLRRGMHYSQIIGLPQFPQTRRQRPLPGDFNEKITIQIPEQAPLDELTEHPEGVPIQSMKHSPGDTKCPVPIVTQTLYDTEIGGSVKVVDSNGNELKLNKETGELISAVETRSTRPVKTRDTHNTARKRKPEDQVTICWVDLFTNSPSVQEWDKVEAFHAFNKGYTTDMSDTFVRACKRLKLPFELHDMYRRWLIETQPNPVGGNCTESDLPTSKNDRGVIPRLYAHWRLPYPTGSKWVQIKNTMSAASVEATSTDIEQAIIRDLDMVIRGQRESVRAGNALVFSRTSESQAVAIANLAVSEALAAKAKKHRKKAALGDRPGPPSNVMQALESAQGHEWARSMTSEMDGLTKMGVIVHDKTRGDILAEGIMSQPVPMGIYFDIKLDQNGDPVKLKSRAAIQGHGGNMQRGVHFFETYAATPQPETASILMALAVQLNLKRKAWDIEKAYCWADIPRNERLAIRYPEGFKRYHPITKEELFMILMKNLYGDPAAGRRWSTQRDDKLLKLFSDELNGWTIKRVVMDPCLFLIKQRDQFMLLSIHTDDCDAVGTSDAILEAFELKANTVWTLKPTDPSYMLGWERIPELDEAGRLVTITCLQTAFVKGTVAAFKEEIQKVKNVTTPFPLRHSFNKESVVSEEEIELYLNKGYQRANGLVLWAARHSFKELKYGASVCSSMLSKPNKEAFEALMHMIKWLEMNMNRGIRFSRDGNKSPVAFSDASNKPMLSNGLVQAGFCIMMSNGPVACISTRLAHVGLSSEHNEYMALCLCIKKLIWIRQLLAEIEFAYLIKTPTIVYGDNIQANKLCKEHFISPGNQYIAQQYHFNKEKIQSGEVSVHWIRSKYNIADLFTKSLDAQTVSRLIPYLLGYHQGFNNLIESIETVCVESQQVKSTVIPRGA